MRSLVCLVVANLLFLTASVEAQTTFGNEWIDYSNQYLKFPVLKEGIYKLDYTEFTSGLNRLGVNVANVDPYKIKIYGRGKEIPVYVHGQADLAFNNGDYILFYGQKNDGWQDSLVYDDPSKIVNPYYSLFNDTSFYYISWTGAVGKRINVVTSTNHSSYTSAPYFYRDTIYAFNSYYNSISEDPFYTGEEGWVDPPIQVSSGQPGTSIKTLHSPNVYIGSGAPQAVIKTSIVGASHTTRHYQIDFSSDNVLYTNHVDDAFYGLDQRKYTIQVPAGSLSSQNYLRYATLPDANSTGRLAYPYIHFRYPHTNDMEGRSSMLAYLEGTSAQAVRFDFTNFNAFGGNVLCFDVSNRLNINMATAVAGTQYSVLLPSVSSDLHKVFIVSETAGMIKAEGLMPVTLTGYFTNFNTNKGDYIIITHPLLVYECNNYKAYRSSVSGGMFTPIVVDVNELYDQFGFGIPKNPVAIRNFSGFASKWTPRPQYVFIIGKGAYSNYIRQSITAYAKNLVPTFGYPPSDIALTTSRDSGLVPLIPIGRLAAKTPDEVEVYLNKVKQYDEVKLLPSEVEKRDWIKHVLHFGGGSNSGEQAEFRNYLSDYESLVEDTSFGGKVHTFLKTSAAPIQITLSDSIRNLINNGVSLMNFFGHASGSSFDQSIDDPGNYSNEGKYPLILANSCFVGDIHQSASITATGTSESFVLEPKAGAIGFIAQVGLGYASELFVYNKEFLLQLFRKNYGKSFGVSMKETIRTIGIPSNILRRGSAWGMTLHGDPAIAPVVQSKPDIALHTSNISFQPAVITAETDSVITLNITLTNLGKATNETFVVNVTRIFPDNSTDSVNVEVNGLHYQKTIQAKFPVQLIKASGMNFFEIYADHDLRVEEVNEDNNKISVPLYIRSNAVLPVFPYQFSVVPADTLTLKASTGDPFAPLKSYRFEIDTTARFNSPWKRSQIVSQTGGIIATTYNSWNSGSSPVSLILSSLGDSTVFYWRVSPDTAGQNQNALWKESSFQYIKRKRGWEQAHLYQFRNDGFTFLQLDLNTRALSFTPNQKKLIVQTYGNPSTAQLYDSYYKFDATLMAAAGCLPGAAIHVAVFEPETLEPWLTTNRNFDNTNSPGSGCSGTKAFIFHVGNATEMAGLSRMIDSVPNGHYFLAYTYFYYPGGVPVWADPTVKPKLTALGFNGVNSVANDIPFILFIQKGNAASKVETFGTNNVSKVYFDTTLTTSRTYGEIISPVIGPASRWDSLSWNFRSADAAGIDKMTVKVYGINSQGIESELYSLEGVRDSFALSNVSATQFPFLRLKATMTDSVNNSPLQLDRWHVLYAPVPEAAVNPARGFTISPSSPQEGETFTMRVPVENISDVPMDSMAVTGYLQNSSRANVSLPVKKYKPLQPGEYVNAELTFNTTGYAGDNLFWLEANPLNPNTGAYFQPEQHHFNNYAQTKLTVKGDKENPLLDVTFDGIHIMNGDIVSARPEIIIQVKDENKFLLIDTSGCAQIFIKFPDSEEEQLLPYDGNVLRFVKATTQNNKARIEYNPLFAKDGVYQLRVQARDASSNQSGLSDYKITFEVINRSTITEVMNYPNPFSTSTRFVFTLTGSQLPTYFKIQIMTITGKVVREINTDELGPIHIGRNITEYAWDGKDQYGDQLGNGVYFYRVVTRINSDKIEHMATPADQYFHKGLGKMYLMR